MSVYINEFVKPAHFEHEIQATAGGKIGVFRLKPNRVLWKPKGQRQFFSVPLTAFIDWIASPKTEATRTKS
jgi:hypothetical protein